MERNANPKNQPHSFSLYAFVSRLRKSRMYIDDRSCVSNIFVSLPRRIKHTLCLTIIIFSAVILRKIKKRLLIVPYNRGTRLN